MSGREVIVGNSRFVVLWMLRGAVAPAFRVEGAFNDVVLRLEPGASPPGVLEAVDRELVRYGGRHAVPRGKQASNYALSSELSNLRTLALMTPAMFLAVAAFLVNVVVSRLVFLERTQIAVLKALGFADRRIARHHLVPLSALGIAMGIAIFVMGRFSWDSFDHLMAEVFPREHQEDLTVTVVRALPGRALREIEHLPGVALAEGQRIAPVRFHAGPRWRDSMIVGLPGTPQLRHLLDHGTRPLTLHQRGRRLS
jgi:hypothetical protein